jgi:hypothetical protein
MKLEKLTPEQEKIMIEIRDEWINIAFSDLSKGIDRPMFEEGVKWLYVDLLKKPMPKVIYCDSWLSCLLTISILKNLPRSGRKNFKLGASVQDSVWASVQDSVWASVEASVRDSVGDSVRNSVGASVEASVRDSVWDSVGDSVWDSVGDSVRDSVGASVEASVGDSVRDSVWDSVWDSVRDSVGDSVRDSVGASVRDSVRNSVWDSVRNSVWDSVRNSVWASVEASVGDYSSYNGWSNFGWVSFYDFFEKINVLDDFKFREYKKLIKSRCFNAYEYENFIFAIQPPTKIERNRQGQLHNVNESSVKFIDGSEYFFVNGRNVPEKYFAAIQNKTFTIDDFSKEENEEYKSSCIALMQEKYGEEYLVNFFKRNLTEVDTFVDKKEERFLKGTTGGMNVGVYTLFKGEINGEKIAYVRCYCPSTDRMFFLGVDSGHKNAKDAIASLYRIPTRLKPHIKAVSRQGERFSTILTTEGKAILKTMSKEEIADNTTLDGYSYFNLMKYEY